LEKPKKKLSAYNRYMSKALKGKMTGKTKAQRKAIFKAAAKGWKKGKSTPRSQPKSRASPAKGNPTGGNRRMAKNSFNMSKIYGLVRKSALFAPAAIRIAQKGFTEDAGIHIVKDYLGIDMRTGLFLLGNLRRGWEPFVYANVITRVIPKIGSFIKGLIG